ncbi:MAG: hypothetical protein KKC75_08885 [Nanoarchaeota archaeon]|nr:hypothetical protein [Nanoarchaeota archaeon]MBU1005693.1 hypothetical protein [Nanoarchaeota archaeon]MBU1946416.1 hypothetical protein [Nanoarchaeota archaeon]
MRKRIKKEAIIHHPKLSAGKKIILSLPVVMSVSWMIYLQYVRYNYMTYGYSGEMMAPASIMPVMTALILFTAGYILFLAMMFSENIKEYFANRHVKKT